MCTCDAYDSYASGQFMNGYVIICGGYSYSQADLEKFAYYLRTDNGRPIHGETWKPFSPGITRYGIVSAIF